MKQVIYTTEASAKRAAKRLKKPTIIKLEDDKMLVRETKGDPLHNAELRVKSSVSNPVKLVWDLCFKHPKAKRRDIVTMAIEAGVSLNTAKTQYQYWRTASKGERQAHAHA